MAKIPKKPEEIFPEITGDYRKIFGEDLISIILYGSGAGEDYIPGKSDLNFLITLTDRGLEGLDRVLETVGRWRKRNVAIPLFMTREYLTDSQDAYPIEFLNMKRIYIVVTGEDVLVTMQAFSELPKVSIIYKILSENHDVFCAAVERGCKKINWDE
jgi:hypothetical protein